MHYIDVFLIIITISLIGWDFVIMLCGRKLYAYKGVPKSRVSHHEKSSKGWFSIAGSLAQSFIPVKSGVREVTK